MDDQIEGGINRQQQMMEEISNLHEVDFYIRKTKLENRIKELKETEDLNNELFLLGQEYDLMSKYETNKNK